MFENCVLWIAKQKSSTLSVSGKVKAGHNEATVNNDFEILFWLEWLKPIILFVKHYDGLIPIIWNIKKGNWLLWIKGSSFYHLIYMILSFHKCDIKE